MVTKVCQYCGKEFETKNKKAKFCSLKCVGLSQRKRKKIKCFYCGKEFEYKSSKVRKYCCASCRSKATFEEKREIFAKTSKGNGKLIDLTGKRFGKLVVIKRVDTRNTQPYWLCKCDCGNEKVIAGHTLRSGQTKSCGCLVVSHGEIRPRHNETKTRLYHIWQGMKDRCLNKNNEHYNKYGGRGITFCNEWKDYFAFKKWALANGYSDNLSIDRINNDGNYEPSNCRWATSKQQSNNTRFNHNITYKGETHSVSEWTRILGFKSSTLSGRIHRGWSIEKAFTTPLYYKKEKTK